MRYTPVPQIAAYDAELNAIEMMADETAAEAAYAAWLKAIDKELHSGLGPPTLH